MENVGANGLAQAMECGTKCFILTYGGKVNGAPHGGVISKTLVLSGVFFPLVSVAMQLS